MKSPGLRTLSLWLLCALFAASTARAQWQSIGNLDSYATEQNGVTLKSGATLVRILILAPDLVRIRVATEGVFLPDQSWAVVKKDWANVPFEVRDSNDELQLATGELVVSIRKNPLRFSFLNRDGRLINKDDEGQGISMERQVGQGLEVHAPDRTILWPRRKSRCTWSQRQAPDDVELRSPRIQSGYRSPLLSACRWANESTDFAVAPLQGTKPHALQKHNSESSLLRKPRILPLFWKMVNMKFHSCQREWAIRQVMICLDIPATDL